MRVQVELEDLIVQLYDALQALMTPEVIESFFKKKIAFLVFPHHKNDLMHLLDVNILSPIKKYAKQVIQEATYRVCRMDLTFTRLGELEVFDSRTACIQ